MDERGSSRDFDFWLGEWDVFGPQERQAGRNSITALYGGGAIAEHWHGAGDVEGHSLNAYDPATDRCARRGSTPPAGCCPWTADSSTGRWSSRGRPWPPTAGSRSGSGSPGLPGRTASASTGRPPTTTAPRGRRPSTATTGDARPDPGRPSS